MNTIFSELLFLKERFTAGSVADILLVALIVFMVMKLMSITQTNTLFRGMVIAFVLVEFLSLFTGLPAFSWLVSKALPAFIIVIPIVFAPEIRRAFEKMGRIGSLNDLFTMAPPNAKNMSESVDRIVDACCRLAANHHGALIVMEYHDRLDRFVETGVLVDSVITSEMLLQVFYPNTPLHDGAVIIRNGRIFAASCVMPLSSRNVLDNSPERHMGLRHRAGLGMSETADCVVIVVSEETGSVSLIRDGVIHRNIEPSLLRQQLKELYHPVEEQSFRETVRLIVKGWMSDTDGEEK